MFYAIILLFLFIVMLLFPKATFDGASEGLLLWFQIVLPTLFPFMIVSNLFINTNSVFYISRMLKPFLQRLFRISEQACYVVLIGFLCGYPMGAKVISDLISNNYISKEEGKYLLSFCNNTSPMFIISFIVMQNFKLKSILLPTVFILFLSPFLCSFLFRLFYRIPETTIYNPSNHIQLNFSIFDNAITNGLESITKVGGYIIVFSIIFSLCKDLPWNWFLPTLEISSGIPWIMSNNLPLTVAYPYVLACTSFGGFCSIAQTYSVMQETKLPLFPYIIEKLITATVTSLLALLYIHFIHR